MIISFLIIISKYHISHIIWCVDAITQQNNKHHGSVSRRFFWRVRRLRRLTFTYFSSASSCSARKSFRFRTPFSVEPTTHLDRKYGNQRSWENVLVFSTDYLQYRSWETNWEPSKAPNTGMRNAKVRTLSSLSDDVTPKPRLNADGWSNMHIFRNWTFKHTKA